MKMVKNIAIVACAASFMFASVSFHMANNYTDMDGTTDVASSWGATFDLNDQTGVGYDSAYIDNDECLELNIKDGRIDSVDIKCQKPYTYIPKLIIKNPGVGAILRPVMSTQPRIVQQELIQSIDCVGDFPNPGDS